MLSLSLHARNKEMMAKGLVKDVARRITNTTEKKEDTIQQTFWTVASILRV